LRTALRATLRTVLRAMLRALLKTTLIGLSFFPMTALAAEETPPQKTAYRVIDSSYTVCKTQAQYQQLIRWSLYGVGGPPQTGCLPAPAKAKAIILQCPESDIIICQFELTPEDGSPVLNVWASKVMLMPVTPSVTEQ